MSPFRKATGTSRNLAVAILEQFDSEGLTRRSGKGRILLRRPERNA
ncbi:MAG: SelB domain-containing protein [Planctomycetota bacterium]